MKRENMGRRIMKVMTVAMIVLYVGFVATDCIRLSRAKSGTQPFITISQEKTENQNTYIGLGYTISYYVDRVESNVNGKKLIEERGYGAEFRLFGRILLWAWVE